MKKVFLAICSFLLMFLFIGCNIELKTEEELFVALGEGEESITLEVGEEHILDISTKNVTLDFEYDTSIISISNYKITGLKEGKTIVNITVKEDEELGLSFEVTVTKKQEPADVLVSSITLTGKDAMTVSDTQTIEANVLPSDATNKALTWLSSDESVATVDQNGLVKALSSGVVTISAKATDGSNVEGKLNITISDIMVSSITITGASEVKEGESTQLEVNILPNDVTNKVLVWTTSDESVAAVDKGYVTGIKAGVVTITAKSTDGSNVSSTHVITVLADEKPVEPTAVILVCNGKEYQNKDSVNLEVGGTYAFSFKYLPADKNVLEGVDYSLYDEKYCKIENDAFVTTAIGRVAFQVYATNSDAEALFVINVTEKYYAPTEIVISTDALYVEVGLTAKFTASILPAEAHQNVVWSTNDPSIATIDSEGVLTGVGIGFCKVIATPADGEDLKQEYDFEVKENTTVDKLVMVVDPSFTATGSTVTVDGNEYKVGKNAFDCLGDALNAAVNGSVIYVASGEYKTENDTATLLVNNVTVIGPNYNVNPVSNHDREGEAKVSTAIILEKEVSNFTVNGLYLQNAFNIKLLGDNENIEASFNYIYATTADGIITFTDAKSSVKGLKANFNYSPKYVAYRFLYAINVEDVEIIGNELYGSNEIQYFCDVLNVQGVIKGTVTIRDNKFDKLYQSIVYSKGVGQINVLFQNNYCSNITCTIVDFRDLNGDGNNTFNILYNTFDTCGRFVEGNTNQTDWGMVRISTAGYKDTDSIEVNVNYNIFNNAESDDDGLFVAWNRGKSSSLEKFIKIVNYDYNYINGKTSSDWPTDYFGYTDLSVEGTYTNMDDVPTTSPLDPRLLTSKRTITINKFNSQDATSDFEAYYGLCMYANGTTPGASLYWQKVALTKNDDGTYTVSEVKVSGESMTQPYDYLLLKYADGQGNENDFVSLGLTVGEIVIFSEDLSQLEAGACSVVLAVVE